MNYDQFSVSLNDEYDDDIPNQLQNHTDLKKKFNFFNLSNKITLKMQNLEEIFERDYTIRLKFFNIGLKVLHILISNEK